MSRQSRSITVVLEDDADEMGYARIVSVFSMVKGVSRIEFNCEDKDVDWQVVVTATAWIEEVDCNSGKRRRIYSSGKIEAL